MKIAQLCSEGPELLRRYSYDRDGLLMAESTAGSAAGADAGGTYSYTSLGQLKSYSPTGGSSVAYSYDKAGNRTGAGSSSFVYDQQNRLISGGGQVFTWSDRGTLASSLKGSTLTSYGFDVFAQELVAGSVTYSRDSFGRISSRNGQGFAYSGLSSDVCSDGLTVVNRDAAGSSPVSVKEGSQASWVLTDQHSDVVELRNRWGLTATRSYDPYGVVENTTGSFVGQVGFQSDWTDPSTGEVDMGARMYMPSVASFTSRDSYAGKLDTPVSLNRYTYGHNNPLRYLDPTGRYAVPRLDGSAAQYMRDVAGNINEHRFFTYLDLLGKAQAKGASASDFSKFWSAYNEGVLEPQYRAYQNVMRWAWESAHPPADADAVPVASANLSRREFKRQWAHFSTARGSGLAVGWIPAVWRGR